MMVDSYDSLDTSVLQTETNLYMCMFFVCSFISAWQYVSLSVPLLLSPLCRDYFLVVDYYNTYGGS